MSYTKNTWVDQDVERPRTYEVTNNQDGSITLTDSFGLVQELGTPVNAVNMNHIEDGIDGCAIRKHNLTETFNLGEWVLGGTGDDEGIYKSLIANNVGNALTDRDAWEKVKMGGASGRNVGEIIQSSLPLTDAGLHLLDGSLLQYGIYQEFIDYIADLYTANPTANYFTDETTWQNSVTQYGSCGKFVYSPNDNTVRLPKITGIIEGTIDIKTLGNITPQDVLLPNIYGSYNAPNMQDPSGTGTGAFAYGGGAGFGTPSVSQDSQSYGFNFSAARVSSVYSGNGSNTKIQPQSTKVFYYIVIANSTKTDIQVDIDEIATDLNGKADKTLSNVTDQAKILMGGMAMPSDKYINLTLGASNSQYTAPANGWFAIVGLSTSNRNNFIVLANDVIQSGNQLVGYANNELKALLPASKNTVVTATYENFAVFNFRFYYAVGSESEAS